MSTDTAPKYDLFVDKYAIAGTVFAGIGIIAVTACVILKYQRQSSLGPVPLKWLLIGGAASILLSQAIPNIKTMSVASAAEKTADPKKFALLSQMSLTLVGTAFAMGALLYFGMQNTTSV